MKWLLLFLLLFVLPAMVRAGEAAYEKGLFGSGGATLPYRLLRPVKVEPGKKYPLILFLHGAGERGTDNERQLLHGSGLFLKPENREKFPCFVVFPQCPEAKAWVEVPWGDKKSHEMPAEPSVPLKLTKELVDKLIADKPVDTDRIYVMGLSMGGFGTWDFAARYPSLVAAVVPICGGADDRTAPKFKDIPVWSFHGAKDSAVWPERSRSMVEALKKAGAAVKYTEYPDVGHDSWNRTFNDPELLPWLFAQKRSR
jgi:predicted peptidase